MSLRAKVQMRIAEASHHLQSSIGHILSRPSRAERIVLHDLQHEGVHVTSLDRLLPEAIARETIARAAQLLKADHGRVKPALWSRARTSTDLDPRVMLSQSPELYLIGLQPSLLSLAHHYLALPVAYHGAVLRHSLIDGIGAGPRLWHQDAEDFHVLRVVVYLSDVTAEAGPFEYVPRHRHLTYGEFEPGAAEDLTDERMSRIVPRSHWRRCLGPAGTVVLADTARVFHHESLQVNTERFVLMIGYSSRRPKSMDLAAKHFPVETLRSQLASLISPELYPYVFDWRRAD